MTLALQDISRLLYIIKIYQNNSTPLRNYVQRTFNDEPIKQARLPNYEIVEKFCEQTKLINVDSNSISLTTLGKTLVKIYEEKKEISEEFKDFFVKDCLFECSLGKKILDTLKKFNIKDGKKWYPKEDVYELFEFPQILPLLYESGVLSKKNHIVEINPEYSQFKVEKRLTQKQLDEQLKNWKITGDIAEEIVLEFEKNRLKKQGHKLESEKVEIISKDFANAGYDIVSFFEYNNKMEKIYVEVKGSTEKEFDFYWSANELEKARELGDKYWIYFVSEIDVKNKTAPTDPIRIQDPAETLFSDPSYKVETEKYHITKIDSI